MSHFRLWGFAARQETKDRGREEKERRVWGRGNPAIGTVGALHCQGSCQQTASVRRAWRTFRSPDKTGKRRDLSMPNIVKLQRLPAKIVSKSTEPCPTLTYPSPFHLHVFGRSGIAGSLGKPTSLLERHSMAVSPESRYTPWDRHMLTASVAD